MTLFRSLAFAALVAAAHGEKQWVIDETSADLVMMGLGAADATHAVAATSSQTGAEPSFYSEDAGWTKTTNSPNGALMDMAATAGNDVAVYSTFSGPYTSTDQGASWVNNGVAYGVSQSVNVFDGTSFGVVGAGMLSKETGGSFNGILLSTDGRGAEWTAYPTDAEYPRYGAFPSTSTWYMTCGSWPNTQLAEGKNNTFLHAAPHVPGGFALSEGIRVGRDGLAHHPADSGAGSASVGYFGEIWKTADAGETWTKVYASKATDAYYFNAISCSSDDHCVAVAEGTGASDVSASGSATERYVMAMLTTDGGATWERVFESYDYQASMAVTLTSATEGWMSPSRYANPDSPLGVATDFLFTTDGGATWAVNQTLDSCISTYLDNADGLTISTCLVQGGLESRAAFYQ